MNNILNQLLTGKDNQTHDIVRWSGLFGTIAYIGFTAYSVLMLGNPFSYAEFAAGLSAMWGALGLSLKLKETTEPT